MAENRKLIPLQVLIADDHTLMREGVRTILSNNSEWEVCGEAADGQETVEKVRKLRPDLVIHDISMPMLSGIAAARQIRELAPETKIIILTMHENPQLASVARQAGADAVVTKRMATSASKQQLPA
jgi:DNA-binding NarL/FixJ family response regulator